MNIFDRFETTVQALRARTEELESARQHAIDYAREAERRCSAMKEEIRKLRRSLDSELRLRQEAMGRIDAILGRLRPHANAK